MPGFEVIGEEEYKEIRDLFENSKILFRHGFDKIRNDIYIVRDFEKKFIRAETVTCDDFFKYGSAEKCKENGKLRVEGKDYIVKDGDVLYFRVNS